MKVVLLIGLSLLLAAASSVAAQENSTAARITTAIEHKDRPPLSSEAENRDVPQSGAANVRPGSSANYDLGVKYALAGHYEQAIEAFQRAVRYEPKDADAYFSLGNAYAGLHRWKEAVEAYQQALRLNRNDGEASRNLGLAYYNLGEYAQAIEAFKRAIHIYPTWAEAHFDLSNAYYKAGRLDDAESSYQQAVKLKPDYYLNRPALVSASKPPANNPAGNNVAPPINEPPTTTPSRSAADAPNNAAPKGNGSSSTTSVRVFTVVTGAPNPKGAKAFYQAGEKYGRAKKYKEAIESFKQALLLKPDYADAYFGLGHAYADLGRWREAIEAYEQVLRLDPKDEETHYRLSEAYLKLKTEADSNISQIGSNKVGVSNDKELVATGERVSAPAETINASGGIAAVAAAASAAPATVAAVDPTNIYRVGPGDVLDVRLLNATGNSSSDSPLYTVTASGLLEYPLLGDPLSVNGLTADEISAHLAVELKRRAVQDEPHVVVGVREYASHNIIISGLVSDPGTKVLRREAIPLYVVLADAQPRPEAGQVVIVSADKQKRTIRLDDQVALNTLVHPSDIITVQPLPPQFFYIGGHVDAPGEKPFHSGMTLTQAILSSGGSLTTKGIVKLLRQDSRGILSTVEYKLRDITSGQVIDPPLQPDDRIEVAP